MYLVFGRHDLPKKAGRSGQTICHFQHPAAQAQNQAPLCKMLLLLRVHDRTAQNSTALAVPHLGVLALGSMRTAQCKAPASHAMVVYRQHILEGSCIHCLPLAEAVYEACTTGAQHVSASHPRASSCDLVAC